MQYLISSLYRSQLVREEIKVGEARRCRQLRWRAVVAHSRSSDASGSKQGAARAKHKTICVQVRCRYSYRYDQSINCAVIVSYVVASYDILKRQAMSCATEGFGSQKGGRSRDHGKPPILSLMRLRVHSITNHRSGFISSRPSCARRFVILA